MPRLIFWLFLISLIFLRYIATRPVYNDGDKIRITSKVSSEPIRYSNYQSLKLVGLKIYLPLFPEIHYGDKVVIEGTVDGDKLKETSLVKVEEGGGLRNLRNKIVEVYREILSEPHASLVAGIVLGSKNMPQDFWQALTKTGTAHVVVASGMNVTMVASFLIVTLTLFFKRKFAILGVLVGVFIYSLLSGFDAPIIRAGIMGMVAFIAQETGRLVSAWRALVYSAALMLLVKPDWVGDIGFILSFVATASLLVFQKKINLWLKLLPNFLREGLSTSLAAQVGVAPILFVTFGQFNILSPIINGLILWTVPFIMIIGGTSGIIGLLIPSLARLILYLAYPLSWWFISIIDLMSNF